MLKFFRNMQARRMNKIVEEVRQQLIEEMELHCTRVQGQLESYVINKVNHMEIDYDELAENLDDWKIADSIDYQSVADHLDHHHLAQEIDAHDVAMEMDAYDVAQEMCHYEISQNLDMDELADKVGSNLDLESMNEGLLDIVDDKISDALDELEITRG